MENVSIIDCPVCGQRYIMHMIEHEEIVTGEKQCACGASLGNWHGHTSLEYSSLDLDGVVRDGKPRADRP
ncbi:MAG: hypothetical protein ABL932_18530 [Terricaulis sp.]